MSVKLPSFLAAHWEATRAQLLAGTYQPQPVKRQEIRKPGGGIRQLGIPTVLDRMIQQAILQVLQPRFDPTFSEHSYGFRPGRRAHDAVLAAQRYIQEGRRVVVDVDLEKFFDRVHPRCADGEVVSSDRGPSPSWADPSLPRSRNYGGRSEAGAARGDAARRSLVAVAWPMCSWMKWIVSWKNAGMPPCGTR
jgi:hypothetical protein